MDIRISAKDLGALAMPDFCPRCFWLKRNVKALPFQIFPGIFSSIDAYTKNAVHAFFDMLDGPPSWLPELKDAKRYLKAPHWSKFQRKDPVTKITLSGAVDDLFECHDGTHIIVDYKTAKYTDTQDKLFPMYEAQLNGYGWIHSGFGNVVRPEFPLIYCEPITANVQNHRYEDTGFNMGFTVKSVTVRRVDGMVESLLQKANEILSRRIPAITEGCKDCSNLSDLMGLIPYDNF